MTGESSTVKLISNSGDEADGTFYFDSDKHSCTLIFRYANRELTATEDDFFEALSAIRQQLESVGLRPRCYGASKNVFPSGMSRDMGGGFKAYKMRLGVPARTEDLVDIFDTGPDAEPVSVEEQEQYFRRWLASLG